MFRMVASHVAVSHVRVRVRVREAATWETATWTVTVQNESE